MIFEGLPKINRVFECQPNGQSYGWVDECFSSTISSPFKPRCMKRHPRMFHSSLDVRQVHSRLGTCILVAKIWEHYLF